MKCQQFEHTIFIENVRIVSFTFSKRGIPVRARKAGNVKEQQCQIPLIIKIKNFDFKQVSYYALKEIKKLQT